MKNDVAEMALSSQVFTCQCQLCKAQLQLTCSWSSAAEPGSSISGTDGFCRNDQACVKEALGLVQNVLESNNERLTEIEDSFVVLKVGGNEEDELDTQEQSRWTVTGVEMNNLEALDMDMDICSLKSGVQYPLCGECSLEVEKELMSQIYQIESRTKAFEMLNARYREEQVDNEEHLLCEEQEVDGQIAELEGLLESERQHVQDLEIEVSRIKAQGQNVQETTEKLCQIEQAYWAAFHTLHLRLHDTADFRDILQSRMKIIETRFTEINSVNVLADVFRISFDGSFGKISGLRLGSVPEEPAEWWEINGAWGQAVLLLDIIAKSVRFQFDHGATSLEAKGSYSRIHDKEKGPSELFGPVSKILCLGFDRAQVQYLHCMKQLGDFLKSRGVMEGDQIFSFRYPIEGDRVGGYSIRYGLARDKAWTKALKYLLADLKQCLQGVLTFLDSNSSDKLKALPREGPFM